MNEMIRVRIEEILYAITECDRCHVKRYNELVQHAQYLTNLHVRITNEHHLTIKPRHQSNYLGRIFTVKGGSNVATSAGHVEQWQRVQIALVHVHAPH